MHEEDDSHRHQDAGHGVVHDVLGPHQGKDVGRRVLALAPTHVPRVLGLLRLVPPGIGAHR